MGDIPNLYRIILQVADLKRGAEFYSRLLGIEGRDIRGSRYYFDCGRVILALVDPTAEGDTAKPNSDNVYFSVRDLEAVYGRARELDCLSTDDVHGAAAGEIVKRPWGERSFYVIDPWGNQLCFVDEATVFTGK